jgi:PadR family transcriptional regulator PadR
MVPADKEVDPFRQVKRGLLEFAVLSVIATRRVYAADIIERLADTPFAVQEATLYPLLSKLRRDSLVAYDWQESASGPPRKYYSLAAEGETRLAALRGYWNDMHDALEGLERTP